jgi:hypothetical protein
LPVAGRKSIAINASFPAVAIVIVFVTVPGVALSKNRRRLPEVNATIVSPRAIVIATNPIRTERRAIFFMTPKIVASRVAIGN